MSQFRGILRIRVFIKMRARMYKRTSQSHERPLILMGSEILMTELQDLNDRERGDKLTIQRAAR